MLKLANFSAIATLYWLKLLWTMITVVVEVVLLLKCNRARQLYKNISMLFLFPVKDGKLSTGVNATFNASCYG